MRYDDYHVKSSFVRYQTVLRKLPCYQIVLVINPVALFGQHLFESLTQYAISFFMNAFSFELRTKW